MIKNTLLLISVSALTYNHFTKPAPTTDTPRVTGIGGIFFKTKDPKATKDWYGKNLGLVINDYGSTFESKDADHPENATYTEWSPFKETAKDFDKEYMIDYRVNNIVGLVANIKANGVTVVDTIASYGEIGKFVHILDNDGTKVELWEPVASHKSELKTTK